MLVFSCTLTACHPVVSVCSIFKPHMTNNWWCHTQRWCENVFLRSWYIYTVIVPNMFQLFKMVDEKRNKTAAHNHIHINKYTHACTFSRCVWLWRCASLPLQPKVLSSPNAVLQSQKAMCFEYATLLCSLLVGEDYDAYCVSGYAVKEMCLLDQSLQECPLLDPEIKVSACSVHMWSTIRLLTPRCESDFLVVCLHAGCGRCDPRTEGPGW